MGRIDAARRRTLLFDRIVTRWRDQPPAGFVCAAGVTDTAPAVARVLRCVSEMPGGSVVFAGLDLTMPAEEWDALGPHKPDPVTGRIRRSIETHPQYALKLLLDRMGVGRDEVTIWRGGGDYVWCRQEGRKRVGLSRVHLSQRRRERALRRVRRVEARRGGRARRGRRSVVIRWRRRGFGRRRRRRQKG